MSLLFKAIKDLFTAPAIPEEIHDENVHRLRNVATITLGEVERALRHSRKLAQQVGKPEEIEAKVSELRRLTGDMHKIIRGNDTDPDDGLMRGMDEP
jgi:3-methyladenine DNA glycosylase/8-oxoguanine DNA glycosylase